MRYLALGDSMSIDTYTGRAGGGAVSQFAALINATEVQDLTYDGCTTDGVLDTLEKIEMHPDIITVTAGGNDLLLMPMQEDYTSNGRAQDAAESILRNIRRIADALSQFKCTVIMNTIYDPSDGDDLRLRVMGFSTGFRAVHNLVNEGIKTIAAEHDYLLADLETLFHGHGMSSSDAWVTMQIEPNLQGATAIANEWNRLFGNKQY